MADKEKPLTERQRQVLEIIASIQQSDGVPVLQDIADELGVARNNVHVVLNNLSKAGYAEVRGGTRGRSLQVRLLPKGKFATRRKGIPVVGCIRAGLIEEALQSEVIEMLETIEDVFPDYREDDIALEVKGESMAPEILPGDRVLLRKGCEPQNHQIAAVYVGDEYCSTLKRLHFSPDGQSVTLCATNPCFEDKTYPRSKVTIVGVMKGLVRNCW